MARHLKRRLIGASVALFSLIQGTTAHAAQKLTGKDIKDGTLTFSDFKKGEVVSADSVATLKHTLKSYAVKWRATQDTQEDLQKDVSTTEKSAQKAEESSEAAEKGIADLGSWKTEMEDFKDKDGDAKANTDKAISDIESWKDVVDDFKSSTESSQKELDTKVDDVKSDLESYEKSAPTLFLKIDGTAVNSIKWNGLTTDQVILGAGSVRAGNATPAINQTSEVFDLVTLDKFITVRAQYDKDTHLATFSVANASSHTLEYAQEGSATQIAPGDSVSTTIPAGVGSGGLETIQIVDAADTAVSATLTVSAVAHAQIEKVNLHATVLGTGG